MVRGAKAGSLGRDGPVSSPVIDAQYLKCITSEPIDDDVRQTGNNQLAGAWDPSDPASPRQKTKAIGGIEQGAGDHDCSIRPVSSDVFGNLFKILSGGFGPSYLYWIRHLWSLGFQNPLDSFPNLRWREQLTAICCVDSRPDGRAELCFFRQIAVHRFARKFFSALAGLIGYLRKLRFLLGLELHFHVSEIKSVCGECQPAQARPANSLVSV